MRHPACRCTKQDVRLRAQPRVALLGSVTCMSTVSLAHYHPIHFPTLFGVSFLCNGRCMDSFDSLLLKPQAPHCKHIIHSSGGLIVVADDAMVCTLTGHVSPLLAQSSWSTQDSDAASHVQDGNIQSSRRPRTSPHVGHTCQRNGRRESSPSSKLNELVSQSEQSEELTTKIATLVGKRGFQLIHSHV